MSGGSEERRRRRIDPLRVIIVVVLLATGAIVAALWSTDPIVNDDQPRVTLPPPPAPADAGPAMADVVVQDDDVIEKLDEKSTRTKKGRLLKEQLKKRLAEEKKAREGGARVATGSKIPVVLSGDSSLKLTLSKKLSGVKIVDDGASGFLLSLRNDTQAHGDEGSARCSAAISVLPQRKLVASLSSRADVAGGGMSAAELKNEASTACAASLADDVSAWLRAHKNDR
jgi:hypothetical protein